jgi:hypothetical protein
MFRIDYVFLNGDLKVEILFQYGKKRAALCSLFAFFKKRKLVRVAVPDDALLQNTSS